MVLLSFLAMMVLTTTSVKNGAAPDDGRFDKLFFVEYTLSPKKKILIVPQKMSKKRLLLLLLLTKFYSIQFDSS